MRARAAGRGALSVLGAVAVTVMIAGAPTTALAGDSPAGFYYGTDTNHPGPNTSGPVYKLTSPLACSGDYGSYVGRIETSPDSDNNETFSNDANKNANDDGVGIGSQNYYVLSGPDGLSGFNGSASEATTWGEDQGNAALSNYHAFYTKSGVTKPSIAIIYADLEDGGGGWSSSTSLNRDVFNGFWNAVHLTDISVGSSTVLVFAGVYATADWWADHMSGNLNGTFEWTAQTSLATPSSSDCAGGWNSPDGNIAHFYAGYSQSSACAVSWQWFSGNDDWDQVDAARIQNDVSNVSCN